MHLLGKIILACLCCLGLFIGCYSVLQTSYFISEAIEAYPPFSLSTKLTLAFCFGQGLLGFWGLKKLLKQGSEPIKLKSFSHPQFTASPNSTKKLPLNKDQELHEIFYKLLDTRNGLLTVLNFAAVAKISGQEAKTFLEQKSREFNHKMVLGEEGEMAYKFEYLTAQATQKLAKNQ